MASAHTDQLRTFTLALFLSAAAGLPAQVRINGPMPGHVDMLEATIWMQCPGGCAALLEYWWVERPDSVLRTIEQRSSTADAHVLKFVLDQVVPGTTYGYRVVLDGHRADLGQPLTFRTQPLWRHRTDPPDFTVAMGSCTYVNEAPYDRPGTPYGGGYGIFDRIAALRPDMMLWLGDNVYLREPDWGSWSGIVHRYTHTRSLPELQRLLRSTHHYAIWDDHDFGPNDAVGSFANASLTRRAFDLFWANPGPGVPGVPGITTQFNYGDVDFFLLDDRSFRTPSALKTTSPTLLGAAQIEWLVQALVASQATFKVVAMGGQFLNTAAVYENYATYPEERQQLIGRIEAEGIGGVVFVTGDRHFSELSELTLKDGRKLHDVTVSPLTSGVHRPREQNALRVEGTLVEQRNFALLKFSGPLKERVMTITLHDAEGTPLWTRSITAPKR